MGPPPTGRSSPGCRFPNRTTRTRCRSRTSACSTPTRCRNGSRAPKAPRARAACTPGSWFLLAEVSPLSPPLTQQLPDPLTLAIGSLITLLTASVLEEFFYRAWLQTRLEALYGRWPAILASALLFAAMHVSHINPEAIGVGIASVVAAQGMFGLMQGYLWARYRNIWVIILIHTIVNLVYVDMLI
ncbi:CPBP family intramembrane glutamic endopeptidase [Nonomuraea diastatica]|uniref:CPBP family intramembrane glutamic endopeptidase n=1 Tax=Nonomuraea diastatica TaxID=1848329 RepID=UPI00319E6FB2